MFVIMIDTNPRYRRKKSTSVSDLVTPLALIASFVFAEFSESTHNSPSFFLAGNAGSPASNPLDAAPVPPHPFASVFSSISSASALGAGTLILFGLYGNLRQLVGDGGVGGGGTGGGGRFYPKKRGEPVSVLGLAEKAASIVAPYFAVLELGAVRTAIVVMGALAGGLALTGRNGGWRTLARRKSGVLGAFAMAFLWDMHRSSFLDSGLSFAI